MIDQLTYLLQQYPILQHVVSIMVICRIVFKPIFVFVGKYVELTVEEKDDNKLHKFMKTKTYKMLAFAVDYAASVKLPNIKRKK